MKLCFFGLFAFSICCNPLLAHEIKTVSLRQPVEKLLSKGADKTFEERLDLWISEVESHAPLAYWHIFGRGKYESIEVVRERKTKERLSFLFENRELVIAFFKQFEKTVPAMIDQLVVDIEIEPDKPVNVIALLSLGNFNAHVATINDEQYLMLGIDMIAMIEKDPKIFPGFELTNDLPMVVAHEVTHVLHPYSGNGKWDLYDAMWREGLATLVSQVFVPGRDMAHIFMDRILARECNKENVRRWILEFRKDRTIGFEAPEEERDRIYNKWFGLDGAAELGVGRIGYCLGYHVATFGLRKNSIEELMALGKDPVLELIDSSFLQMVTKKKMKKF